MSLYKQPGSEIWWASVTVSGERIRVSTGEYDQRAAQKFHDKLKAKRHDAPVLKGKKWSTAVIAWVDDEVRSDSDIQSLAKFGKHYPDRLLSSVTVESLDKALKTFCQTDGTYNRYVSRINAILKLAGVRDVVKKRRDLNPEVRDWITYEQWLALRAHLPPHLRAMAEFAVSTGLRQANVLGLRWSNTSVERRTVWVDAPEAKSRKGINVPLSDEALAILKNGRGANPVWVFTFRGHPIGDPKTAFIAACIRAGLGRVDEHGHYEGFTWHGFRHTWATWHVQAGTPLAVLKELGGWADMRSVLRYGHHAPDFVAGFANNTRKKT